MNLKSRKIISMALVFFMMLTILPLAPVTAHAAGTSGGGITLSGDLSDWNIAISDEGVLSWNAQASATKYELKFYEKAVNAYPEVFIGDLTTNSCDLKAAFEAKKIEHNAFYLSIKALNGTTGVGNTASTSGTPDIEVWYVSSLPKLSEPQKLKHDATGQSWDSVPGATGYIFNLYDADGYNKARNIETDKTALNFYAEDGWWFTVQATADGYRNSNAAESPKYGEAVSLSGGGITLSGDLSDWNIKISDEGVLSWDAQESATKYELEFYEGAADAYPEVFIGDLTTNSCDLKAAFEAKKIEHNAFYLSIKALNGTTGVGYTASTSGTPDIEVWYVSSLPKLSEPQKLKHDATGQSWDSVPGATGYIFNLYDADGYNKARNIETDKTALNFYAEDGWWFTVQATADGYRNSNAAESPKYGEVVTPPATTYTITATAGEGGTVTQTGSGTYSKDDVVTVAAIPNTGYEFVEWQENGVQVSTDAAYTFIVEGNRNLVAVFKAKDVTPPETTYTVAVSASPTEGGTVTKTGDGTYSKDDVVTVAAIANEGYEFVEWKENDTQVSAEATYTFFVEKSHNLVAVFKAKEVTPPGNTIINSVALTGFTVPSDGDNASAGDPAATAESGKGYTFKYGTWFDSTGSTQFNGEFEAGTTYIALLALRAEEGYEFAPTESFAATVNGGAVTVNSVKVSNYSRENDTAYVNVEFTIPAEGGETPEDPAVTGITIDPVSAEVVKGNTQQFTASVSGTGNFSKEVAWSISGGTASTINADGLLTVGADETAETLTVTVKSAADNTKSVTATVTVKKPVPTEYTITATAGENGTITPSGDVKVTAGENQTFTITAKEGYHIKDVKVNGASVGAVSTYTFEKVATNATITAEFEKNTVVVVNHSVEFNYNDGTTPTTIPVAHNATVTKPVDPTREGYIFKGWFLGETEYDFATKVTGPITLIAKWEAKEVVPSCEHEYDNACDATCNKCDDVREVAGHTGGTATCQAPATCTVCEQPYGEKDANNHTYATEWTTDRSNHWHKATCGHDVITAKEAHSYGGDRVCDICNYKKPSSGGSYGGGSYVVPDKDADSKLRIVMQINNKNILVNGVTKVNDVAPVIVGDRTLVPIRVVTELLGGSADWDNATRTVTLKIDGKTMNMTIGKEIPGFGTSAVIMNDRTYVPVRYVMEKLGAEVEWIGATRQIIIEK